MLVWDILPVTLLIEIITNSHNILCLFSMVRTLKNSNANVDVLKERKLLKNQARTELSDSFIIIFA